jgi:hypothetical protein
MELNTEQLTRVFGVGVMTVWNWRYANLIDNKKTALPFHTRKTGKKRHNVYFVWKEVKAWAKQNRVDVVKLPKDL